MKSSFVLVAALALAAGTGGCAWWDSHGWKQTKAEPTTEKAREQCETAVATLKGQPDHDTALRACLDEKVRRGK